MKISIKNWNKIAFVAFAMSVGIASCKKDQNQQQLAESNKSDKVLSYIKSLGFSATEIVEVGENYVVEGDIVFPKNMDLSFYKPEKAGANTGNKTQQYYTGSLVGNFISPNVKIYVDASMTDMMSEIDYAIGQWNNVPNTILRFSKVSNAPYDIIITNANLNGACGQGQFPYNGNPGNLIQIDKNVISANSFEQRQRTITHEIGHCVGFRHTNWSQRGESSATEVPGVGGTDALSLMNAGQCGIGAYLFSEKDKLAVSALYPPTSSGALNNMAGIDIGIDDGVYFWGTSGQVTKGNSTSISGPTQSYSLPSGYTYANILDIGIANTGYTYVWYNNGIMSVGSHYNLGNYIAPKPYALSAGKTPTNVVGLAIAKSNNYCYAWYDDGTVSFGNSTSLGAYGGPYSYSLPPGKTPSDIADIGIAASSGWVYAWYKDGTMSVGTYDDLDAYIPLKPMN